MRMKQKIEGVIDGMGDNWGMDRVEGRQWQGIRVGSCNGGAGFFLRPGGIPGDAKNRVPKKYPQKDPKKYISFGLRPDPEWPVRGVRSDLPTRGPTFKRSLGGGNLTPPYLSQRPPVGGGPAFGGQEKKGCWDHPACLAWAGIPAPYQYFIESGRGGGSRGWQRLLPPPPWTGKPLGKTLALLREDGRTKLGGQSERDIVVYLKPGSASACEKGQTPANFQWLTL